MTSTPAPDVVQRRKDALLAAVKSASRQLNNVRDALEELDGLVDAEQTSARNALYQAGTSLRTIAQIADRWGAQA